MWSAAAVFAWSEHKGTDPEQLPHGSGRWGGTWKDDEALAVALAGRAGGTDPWEGSLLRMVFINGEHQHTRMITPKPQAAAPLGAPPPTPKNRIHHLPSLALSGANPWRNMKRGGQPEQPTTADRILVHRQHTGGSGGGLLPELNHFDTAWMVEETAATPAATEVRKRKRRSGGTSGNKTAMSRATTVASAGSPGPAAGK
jgi:hypothetical protein